MSKQYLKEHFLETPCIFLFTSLFLFKNDMSSSEPGSVTRRGKSKDGGINPAICVPIIIPVAVQTVPIK